MDKKPIINEHEDLAKLSPPDFYKSRIMPKVHQFYEIMSEVSDGKLKVMFPDLARGPFCIAAHMRGLDRILMDSVLEPEFVHNLMRFVVDAHKSWSEERNKFVGEEKHKCKLFNDEIDCPTISPSIYDELIFPYEKELAEFYGGVSYWHSCGNTTQFLNTIKKLPNLDLFHVGPWTSYKEADEVFKDNTALDICLHPISDVLDASEDKMINKILDITESCKHKNFSIRADTFMPYDEIGTELAKINTWSKIAGEYINKA